MKWLQNIFKQKYEFKIDAKYYSTFPEIGLELYFLNPRKDQLPVSKFLTLAEILKQKYNYDRWDYSNEYSYLQGKKKVEKFSSKQFSARTHWLYNSKSDKSKSSLMFQTVIPFVLPGPYSIRFTSDFTTFDITDFEELMTDSEFVCAYCFWEIDDFIQHAPTVQYYELKNLPYDKSRVIKSTDKYTPDGIDITGNPGRSRQVQNMVLRSCWRMWFSENYFNVVAKDKIESFQNANQNIVLENGLYFIELYKSPFDASKPECRAIQKCFNEWIDIEGIYHEQLEKFGARF